MKRIVGVFTILLVLAAIVYVYADEYPCFSSSYLICSPGCSYNQVATWNACSTRLGYCCQYKYYRMSCTGTPTSGFPPCFGVHDQMHYLGKYQGESCPPGETICPSHSPP